MNYSINKTAKIIGLLYLILIFAALFSAIFLRDKIIVWGDDDAATNNIIASQFLWPTGDVADLAMHVLDIPIMLFIYVLLKPVNKDIALLAMLFILIQTVVLVANKLNLIAALGSAVYLKTLDPNLINAHIYLSIKLHNIDFSVGLIFFGFACLVNGYLIFRSGYLPKIIGVLMQVAGLCYVTNRLIVKGVNLKRWEGKSNAFQVSGG